MGFTGHRGGGLKRDGNWNPDSGRLSVIGADPTPGGNIGGPLLPIGANFLLNIQKETTRSWAVYGPATGLLAWRPDGGIGNNVSGNRGYPVTLNGGQCIIDWATQINTRRVRIVFTLDSGQSWTMNEVDWGQTTLFSKAAVGFDSNLYVAAQKLAQPGIVRLHRSTNYGASWVEQCNLTTALGITDTGGFFQIIASLTSTAVALTWNGQRSVSNDGGATWSAPVAGAIVDHVFLANGALLYHTGDKVLRLGLPGAGVFGGNGNPWPGCAGSCPIDYMQSTGDGGFYSSHDGFAVVSVAGEPVEVLPTAWPDYAARLNRSTMGAFSYQDGLVLLNQFGRGFH